MNKFYRCFSLFALLLVSQLAYSGDEARLKKHISYLASDELEGRGINTKGLEKAANYIVDAFKQAGLQPGGENGTWYQPFEVTTGAELGDRNYLEINGKSLSVEKDYIPLGFSSSDDFTGKLVFAGYGITAREYQYDDFADINVSGKCAVVFRGEPGSNKLHSRFEGTESTIYSQVRTKAINAKSKGAQALMVIAGKEDKLTDMELSEGYHDVGIPVVEIKREALSAWISEDSLDTWQAFIDKNEKPFSRIIENVDVDLRTNLNVKKTIIKNVIGYLPGSADSLKDAAIIVGAHYDHLGYGGPASREPGVHEVHNGADDNASGVAAIIELAGAMAQRRSELLRPIIFIAFTGEESGLLGSAHYVANPTIPGLKNTIAMLNFDTVGRMKGNKLIVFGGGTATEWTHILNGYNHRFQFDLTIQTDGYGPSDQASFYARDIPVLHFFTGANLDYHKTTDDEYKINYAGLAKVTRFASEVISYLAKRDKPLTFSTSGAVKPKMQSSRQANSGGRPKVWLGTIPDFAYQKGDGFRLSGVSPGSPCEKARMKAGDLIVRMNDVEVKSIYELSHVLKTHKPGDVITVVFIRDGKEHTMDVTLGER